MPYTEADLIAIRTALLRGERSVQFSDRAVTYRSVEEILRVEQCIRAELTPSPTARPRQMYATSSKGL